MNYVFEVTDKTDRKIRLTNYAWAHIMKRHPMMSAYMEEMQNALKNPTAVTNSIVDSNVHYYYSYLKNKKGPNKFLLVSVKYLNGDGYILSSYFEDKIT